jgi:probable F420-dependent oxidoreductase
MKFGIGIVAADDGLDPRELAAAVEAAGFESIFLADHTHIPVERATPYPNPPYGDLPPEYYRVPDPLVTLAAIASTTSTLRLGTGICLVVERDPIVLAKQVATLDVLSNGRVLLGVGAGWNREEMRNHGTDPRKRMRLMAERIEAMKSIWTESEASYHGEFVEFERIWSWPKPAQRPHPPILVGGDGPTVLDRVLAFGDAWMPNYHRSGILSRAAELRSRADRVVSLQVMGIPADPKVFEEYAAAGFDRVVHWLPSAGRGVVERAFDGYEAAIAEFTGG